MKRTGFIDRQTITFSNWEFPADLSDGVRDIWEDLDRQIVVERFLYISDGLKVVGYLTYPKHLSAHLPCIIYNRGGNREFAKLNPKQIYGNMGRLAAQGYVVIGSQYRGADGSEGQDEFGGRDLHDVFNLIPLLQQLPFADAKNLGIYGWSRGGMMTYLALKQSTDFKAAVIGAGEADLVAAGAHRPKMEAVYRELLRPKNDKEFTQQLQARSAVYWAEQIAPTTPLLIVHGAADWRVQPQTAIRLAQKLLDLKRPVRFVLFEGADHGIQEHRGEVNRMVIDWFDRFLKKNEALPNTEPHGE